ncbi:MAG: PD40 domain-containing protein [Holophagales bacterium]|nr:PD40 domain-containing protein [Holophagales bacterium]
MLTGRVAFARDSATATLAAVLRDDPPPIAGIPHDLEGLLRRCLRKAPAKRFQSMADVRVVLEEVEEALTSGAGLVVATPAPRRRSLAWAGVGVVAAVVLAGGVWLGRRASGSRAGVPAPVPLTSYAGTCIDPALSPDGKIVAFAWNGEKQDNFDVYVKLVGPGAPLRLTTDPAADLYPAFSPDGTQIAFRRLLDGTRSAIVVVPVMGGPERRVADGRFIYSIRWSPDGSALLASRCDRTDLDCGLVVVTVGTGEVRRLESPSQSPYAGDAMPAISPDGRTVAFRRASTRANSEIYLVPVKAGLEPAGEPRRLTHEESTASEPAWTPDGKSIVFSVREGGADSPPGLRIIPASANGEKAERIEAAEGGTSPAISSDGRLAWVRRTRDENIWRRPFAGGTPERIAVSTRRDDDPRYSPDGSRITFASDRSGSPQAWISDADGSRARPLTAMQGTKTRGARWSPDGRSIVFLSNEPGQMEIYRTTPEGQTPQRLTVNPAQDGAPSFSRDGRWIYFGSNRDGDFQVWKMRAEGAEEPVRVTRNGGYAALESPDGRTLFYARRSEEAGFEVLSAPVGGGRETLVAPRIADWGDFDVTAGGIVCIDPRGANERIILHPFDGGPEKVLATLDRRPSFGISVSPDGRWLLYTLVEQDATELLSVDRFR